MVDIDYKRDLLTWVRKDAQEWMKRVHDFQPILLYKAGCFKVKKGMSGSPTQRYKGLTTAMKHHLYTHAPKIKRKISSGESPRKSRSTTIPASTSPDGASGAQRGTIVHQQVEHIASLKPDALSKLYPRGKDPWAVRIHAACQRRGWYPLASEYVVYDPDLRIATAIDLICVTRDGRLIVIEIKTDYANGAFLRAGYAYGYSGHVNVWAREVRALKLASGDCTPAKLARIQVGMGAMMLMRLLRIPISSISPYVIRVDDFSLDIKEVKPPWMRNQGLHVYGYFRHVARMSVRLKIEEAAREVRRKRARDEKKTDTKPIKRIKQ